MGFESSVESAGQGEESRGNSGPLAPRQLVLGTTHLGRESFDSVGWSCDSTVNNGCMQFVRGGHRTGHVARHTIGTSTTTWYTELSEGATANELMGKPQLDESDLATIETKAGGIIIFPGTTPHRSLNSSSDRIRWSVDFRLHKKCAKRAGSSELDWFYGLKDSLLLREDPAVTASHVPDWSVWASEERTAVQEGQLGLDAEEGKANFDPVITGPWMDLWDLESDGRENAHIKRYLGSPEAKREPQTYIGKGNW